MEKTGLREDVTYNSPPPKKKFIVRLGEINLITIEHEFRKNHF
jgi:hypothetical protein